MNGIVLQRTSVFKDLGILFDTKLTFSEHVLAVCKSAFGLLGLIRRSGNFLRNTESLKMLYYSLVRSKLEYGAVIWSPHFVYLIVTIESIQRKFLRFLYYKEFGNYNYVISYSELLNI